MAEKKAVKKATKQYVLAIPKDSVILKRADALVEKLSNDMTVSSFGMPTRAVALRMALGLGIEVLEARYKGEAE